MSVWRAGAAGGEEWERVTRCTHETGWQPRPAPSARSKTARWLRLHEEQSGGGRAAKRIPWLAAPEP